MGWGDSSVGKVSEYKHKYPILIPRTHVKTKQSKTERLQRLEFVISVLGRWTQELPLGLVQLI